MKYTFCEKIIWYAMSGTIVDFLHTKHPNWNIKLVKSNAKNRYKQIIKESPDIGSITKNSLRTCLSSGALWLAFYENCEEKIKDEEFGEMVKASIKSPMIEKAFSSKNPFTEKAQIKINENFELDKTLFSNNENIAKIIIINIITLFFFSIYFLTQRMHMNRKYSDNIIPYLTKIFIYKQSISAPINASLLKELNVSCEIPNK